VGVDEAKITMLALEQAGIPMKEITDRLLEEGLKLFRDAFDNLLDAVEHHCKENII
jgi:transaldolase/glucose-6-phosphate isomerase